MSKTVNLKVKRQDAPDQPARWEEFQVPYASGMNIIGCLMEIRKNPVTVDGKKTTPVAWESSCLEEVCGSCTMVVNGKVRQSCAALVDDLVQPITVEPMKSFPLVRDLMVDRSRMFDALKQVHAWIDLDGTHDLGPGPRQAAEDQEWMYELSKCMTCGCCLEACPNYGPQSDFVGPQAINQVRLFNAHPSGAMHADDRLETIMGDGGISDCGSAQNCVAACPKGIPLTTSIADLNKAVNKYSFKRAFNK